MVRGVMWSVVCVGGEGVGESGGWVGVVWCGVGHACDPPNILSCCRVNTAPTKRSFMNYDSPRYCTESTTLGRTISVVAG